MAGNNKEKHRVQGVIVEKLPGLDFRVKTEDGKEIIAHLAGKLRIHHIKILEGDKVIVETSPYDETKGRIVYRLK